MTCDCSRSRTRAPIGRYVTRRMSSRTAERIMQKVDKRRKVKPHGCEERAYRNPVTRRPPRADVVARRGTAEKNLIVRAPRAPEHRVRIIQSAGRAAARVHAQIGARATNRLLANTKHRITYVKRTSGARRRDIYTDSRFMSAVAVRWPPAASARSESARNRGDNTAIVVGTQASNTSDQVRDGHDRMARTILARCGQTRSRQ